MICIVICASIARGAVFGSHPDVKLFMKGVFNFKPPTVRYLEIWDPETVLQFLKTWSPARTLSLEKLSHNMTITCVTHDIAMG